MKNCRECGGNFVPKEWQIKKKDFLCTPCSRLLLKAYRARRKEEGRPVKSTQMTRAYHAEYESKYVRNPIKYRAGYLARNAVKSGKLAKQPCQVCGGVKVEMHHPDYSKPLKVQWLCKTHHEDAHHKATGESK